MNEKIKIPKTPKISGACKKLLISLLEKDPHKRIGCGHKGVSEIKKHAFFKGIVWEDVYMKKLPLEPVEKYDIKSRNISPNEVFGDYDDFEDESNIGSWSFCKTIIRSD